jgi:hypothetical protein
MTVIMSSSPAINAILESDILSEDQHRDLDEFMQFTVQLYAPTSGTEVTSDSADTGDYFRAWVLYMISGQIRSVYAERAQRFKDPGDITNALINKPEVQ